MKNRITLLLILIISNSALIAQNQINLEISHRLGDQAFAYNQKAINNLDNDFNLKRLEYYISGVTLIHDGGTETVLDSIWILVDAGSTTIADLGVLNVNTVEFIKFHIGVGPDLNHGDPTLFDVSHPLGPKSPSMHWGWTSGYRFIAVEGYGGSNLNNLFELHGLGDVNYHETTVPVSSAVENNVLDINIFADYTRVLEDIDVSSGTIIHGESGNAQTAVENFRDFVFFGSEVALSINNNSINQDFSAYPIPTKDGQLNIFLKSLKETTYNVELYSIDGKFLKSVNNFNTNTKEIISIEDMGTYFIKVNLEDKVAFTKKIIYR